MERIRLNAPMLLPLASLAGGILAAGAGMEWLSGIIFILSGIGLYILILTLSNDPVRSYRLNPLHHIWLILIFFGTGILSYDFQRPYRLPGDDFSGYKLAKGRVKDISYKNSGERMLVTIDHITGRQGDTYDLRNMTMLLKTPISDSKTDDIIIFPAEGIHPIEESSNYFPSGYADYLSHKGIFYEAQCEENELRVCGKSRSLRGYAENTRESLEILIEKTQLDKKTQNFLISILLGDRAYLDKGTRDLYSNAGISHILALSGMHVAIIAGIIMWLLFPMNFYGLYKYRILISTVLLFGYAFITGGAPSTLRAVLMASAIMTCLFLERKNSAWNSLLLAVFIILLFSPGDIYDVGLHLSFLCVASLIFFAGALNPIDHHKHPKLYRLFAAIIVSISAMAGTWCVTAYYFGSIPLMFLPANLLIVPLLPIYLILAIIYLAIAAMTGGASIPWFEKILDSFPRLIEQFVSGLSAGRNVVNYEPSGLSVILYLALLAAIVMVIHYKRNRYTIGVSTLLLIFFIASSGDKAEAARNGFIIQSGIGPVKILVRNNSTDTLLSMTPGTISEIDIHGKRIISCDRDLLESDTCIRRGKPISMAILTSSCRTDAGEIRRILNPREIIIHNSIRRKREDYILHEADSLDIKTHSLRRSKAYRYILPN